MNNFIEKIIEFSVNQEWNIAKTEWKLSYIKQEDNKCVCGKAIKNCCVMFNKINKNITIVGTDCVLKFIGIDYTILFKIQKLLTEDISNKITKKNINYLLEHQFINKWVFDFYISISSQKGLSQKQYACLLKINREILQKLNATI